MKRAILEALTYVVAFALIVLGTSIALCGCGPNSIITPATGPGTDYPCPNVNDVVCVVQKACCDEGETCGGEPQSMPGVPAGYCEFVEPNDYTARRDGGSTRARHKQRPQR